MKPLNLERDFHARPGIGPFLFVLFAVASSASIAQWHWQNPLPQGHTLNSVMFLDDMTGWASSNGGALLKTTDGGSTFEIIDLPERIYASDVLFLDDLKGWTCGQSIPIVNMVLGTTNGGET